MKKTVITGILIFLLLGCSQKNADYYYLKGSEYYKKKNYELTIECFTKAIDIGGMNNKVWYLGK